MLLICLRFASLCVWMFWFNFNVFGVLMWSLLIDFLLFVVSDCYLCLIVCFGMRFWLDLVFTLLLIDRLCLLCVYVLLTLWTLLFVMFVFDLMSLAWLAVCGFATDFDLICLYSFCCLVCLVFATCCLVCCFNLLLVVW